MKTKKIIATLVVLCMVLGCMGVTAMATEETEILVPGEPKVVAVSASGYIDEYVYYSFTPEVSGDYMLSVSYNESLDTGLTVWLSVDDGDEYFSYGQTLVFSAEAGVTYTLCGNYFGFNFTQVEYTFLVEQCQPLEGIELNAESDCGYVDSYLSIDVNYIPANGEREEITWTVSDPAIAEITETDVDYAGVYLVSAGTVTVTATTASGKSASTDITVMELPGLAEGDNDITIPADDVMPFGFTPAEDGYYLISVDDDMIICSLYAESLYDGTNEYYILEAGVTYSGYLYNWSEENIGCTVTIEYFEEVVILEPVSMEIVKLPDNTTYLQSTLYDVWNDDCLTGLELKVTWSDGSVSNWNYDENYGFMGTGYVGGFLNEKEDGGYEVEVYFSAAEIEPVYFDLTILDITAESIALVDETPLQIVEYSCGLDLGSLGLGMEAWYYLPFAAYDREVVITFSDGSTVNALPGDVVYGVQVSCYDNQGGMIMRTQPDGFWSKDSENLVSYYYGDLSTDLTVEIVDSPVESIELVELPEDTFMVDDEYGLINRDGEVVESFRDLLDGMSLKVNYKDGTSKTFAADEIEWRDIMSMGMEFPFVDGYPVGVIGGDWMMMEVPEVPGEIEGYVEYMGVSTTYTIHLVEEFEDDGDTDKPIEINPETGDAGMLLAVLVIAVMSASVVIIKNEKLMA